MIKELNERYFAKHPLEELSAARFERWYPNDSYDQGPLLALYE